MNKNTNPVIFITGGSRGIGKATVERFQAEGWTVAACARTQDALKESKADLKLVCNVADVSEVRRSIQAIMDKFDRLDAVVNNAGIAGSNSLDPNDDDTFWQQIIDVNLNGTYYVSKYALPFLPDKTGRIVNISSVLGLKGVPDATAYCASKHAVLGFTKALAHFASARRITVNAICPGWVRTDMALERFDQIGYTEKNLKTTVPLGRFIEPEEIADLVFYLVASKASAGITGESFTIDGGFLA